ncbi:MAG: c-type cytochrome [Gemmatimonadales bacterium]
MKKVLKWIGIVSGGLLGLLVLAMVVLYASGSARLDKIHEIQPEPIAVPTDESSIARGRHLVEALIFCQECHGDDLAGKVFIDEPMMATVYAPNLTAGHGGVGATYTDADYVRAIRHGVGLEGRGLLIIHADVFHNLSEEDLGAVIAYVKSAPPVDNEIPERRLLPLGRILLALGLFDLEALPFIPAEVIDHSEPFIDMPEMSATAEYGQYLVSITLCSMCHGSDLKGGPPLDPSMPAGPNITAYGGPGGWSEEQFVATIRSGVTPFGKALDPEFMPWEIYANMTDDELAALWRYIVSLNDG